MKLRINLEAFKRLSTNLCSYILNDVSIKESKDKCSQEIKFHLSKKFLGFNCSSLTSTYYEDDLGVYPIRFHDDFRGTKDVTKVKDRTYSVLEQFYEDNHHIFRELLREQKKQQVFRQASETMNAYTNTKVKLFGTVIGVGDQEGIEYKCYFDISSHHVTLKYGPKNANPGYTSYATEGIYDSILNSDYLLSG